MNLSHLHTLSLENKQGVTQRWAQAESLCFNVFIKMVQAPTSQISGKPVRSDPLPDPPNVPGDSPGGGVTCLLSTFTLAVSLLFNPHFTSISSPAVGLFFQDNIEVKIIDSGVTCSWVTFGNPRIHSASVSPSVKWANRTPPQRFLLALDKQKALVSVSYYSPCSSPTQRDTAHFPLLPWSSFCKCKCLIQVSAVTEMNVFLVWFFRDCRSPTCPAERKLTGCASVFPSLARGLELLFFCALLSPSSSFLLPGP